MRKFTRNKIDENKQKNLPKKKGTINKTWKEKKTLVEQLTKQKETKK